MVHLQVFQIVTICNNISNIFIDKSTDKWTQAVQTCVVQGTMVQLKSKLSKSLSYLAEVAGNQTYIFPFSSTTQRK